MSKIYAIRSYQTDLIYIGSTTRILSKRFAEHKKPTNKSNSKEILKYEDAYIELIEEYPCDNKDQLNKKEGEHIRANNCVNKHIAGRTSREYYDDHLNTILQQRKDRYNINSEKIKEYSKHYRLKHREECITRTKEWYTANKDKVKQYKEQNKDKINARRRELRKQKKLTIE